MQVSIKKPKPAEEVRSLIFDLFGVVIAFDEGSVYRRLAMHCHQPETAFQAIQGLVSTPELITGKLTLEQLHERLVANLGLALPYRGFHELWLTPYTDFMPGMADLLQYLSGNFHLVLLSNVDRYYLDVVRRLHRELDHFAAQIVSCEIGVAKPSDAAFMAALYASKAKPIECYFIDDKPENVNVARKLGMRGHVFTTADALRDALIKEGVVQTPGQVEARNPAAHRVRH